MKTTEVENHLKTLRKHVGSIERGLKTIRGTEEKLPEYQAEVERLRKSVDITIDSQLDQLSRARERVQICLSLRESNPPELEAPIRAAVAGIDALNDCLRAAAREEREQLIKDATAALAPFAGTQREDARNGEVSNPARTIAETLPILESIPSDVSNIFQSASTDNMEYRGFVSVAESVLTTAREAITVADAWIKAGGKFCTTALQ